MAAPDRTDLHEQGQLATTRTAHHPCPHNHSTAHEAH